MTVRTWTSALAALLLTTAGLTVGSGTPAHATESCPNSMVGTILRGTADDDVLVGTSGDDWIAGLDGDDVIVGAGGNDVILGGSGNDVIGGGDGCDTLYGGDGNDILTGGDGTDTGNGGTGVNICEVEDPQVYHAAVQYLGVVLCADLPPVV
jgi:Ca2+-binding RTX toxin-like protein